MDETPIWDYEHGRWLCNCVSDAAQCHEENPGDTVYLYDRNSEGMMVNLRLYWASFMPDTTKLKTISGGRIF